MNEQYKLSEQVIATSSPENFLRTMGKMERIPDLNAADAERLREEMSQQQIVEYYTFLENLRHPGTGLLDLHSHSLIRPKILFHASQKGQIKEFEPREEKKRSADEPAQIFSSPSETVSSMFLVPTNNEFIKSGSYDHGETWVYIIGDWENFKTMDKGGYIYTLPTETFGVDPNKGLGLFEWTSQQNVKPTAKKYFSSGLAAMREYGVKIYVVNQEIFSRFKLEENDIKILEALKPYSD